MEDILASIKRIIAEDGVAVAPARRNGRAANAMPVPDEDVLELTQEFASASADPSPEEAEPKPVNEVAGPLEDQVKAEPNIVSMDAALASRQSLSALSALLVKPEPDGEDRTLEGLVREMLRPMLKDWLDAKLPGMVEALVAKEIKRITGGV